MSKWYGKIGYVETVETDHGIWETTTTERPYYGETTRLMTSFQTSGEVNDDVKLTNELSIVADPFAFEHFHAIRYAIFGGVKWKVQSVTPQHPRLLLNIGGVYNG